MAAAGTLMRRWHAPASGQRGLFFWCPGCDSAHSFRVEAPAGHPVWKFDGDLQCPTFTPSLLCFTTNDKVTPPTRRTLCHLFVTKGQIIYCADSPHALKGQTVPMVPFPIHWHTGGPDDPNGDGA